MKKTLEDWLRGDVPHASGSSPASDAFELKLPVVPSHYLPLRSNPEPAAPSEIAPVRQEPLPPAPPEAPEEFLFVDFLRAPAGDSTAKAEEGEIKEEEPGLPKVVRTPDKRQEERPVEDPLIQGADIVGSKVEEPVIDGPDAEDRDLEGEAIAIQDPDDRRIAEISQETLPPIEAHEDPEPPAVSTPDSFLFSGEDDTENAAPNFRTNHDRNQYDYGEKNDGNDIDDVDENEVFQVHARASETPEQEAARFAEQLRRIEQMRRISGTTGRRPGFRGNRGRLFTLCILLILVAGTAFALWKHMQRNSLDALMADADDLYQQERYESAFEVYSHAASSYPARIEPLVGMAHSAERMGHIETAIQAYASVVGALPPDATGARSSAFYETGRLYSILRNRDQAQEYFEKAVDLDPTNYSSFFALGNVLEELDEPEKALPNYKRALDLSPSSDAAAQAVKRITDQLNADKKAAADAAADAQKYGQAIQTGNVALGLKQYGEASQRFAEALAIRSDDATAWVGFADAREGLGDTSGAIKSLERALERDPKNSDARTKLDALTKTVEKKNPPAKKNTATEEKNALRPTQRRIHPRRKPLRRYSDGPGAFEA